MIKYNFKNLNFIVTGAGKGIGKATLDLLYNSGANIAVITRSEVDIKKFKDLIKQEKLLPILAMFQTKMILRIFLN